MNFLYGLKIQYGHQHIKKYMTRSVGNFIFMMKVFSETTEPFKCKLAWNHRIFFLWSMCIVAATKSKFSFFTQPSILFQLQSKIVDLVDLSFLYDFYRLINELVLILNIAEILLAWR